jgi:hypothetical protein
MTAPDHKASPPARTAEEYALQVHELEHAVRTLTREKHELLVRIGDLKATLDQMYGSRGWRALEKARGLGRRRR